LKLANQIYNKIYSFLPKSLEGWRVLELNERFRFYRYQPGQYFKWHRDGSYERELGQESKLTLIIYLNDSYEGGETDFRGMSIKPETGMALIFPHRLMHQGATLIAGVKYALRTDVMYENA